MFGSTRSTVAPRRTARAIVALATASLLSLGACSGDDDDPTGPTAPVADATVTLGLSSFSPSNVRLLLDGTVTWDNTSGLTHNVTFSSVGSPTSIANFAAGTQARDFNTLGVFNYACTIHAGMTGRVTVVEE